LNSVRLGPCSCLAAVSQLHHRKKWNEVESRLPHFLFDSWVHLLLFGDVEWARRSTARD
jgi:hypothetical protein